MGETAFIARNGINAVAVAKSRNHRVPSLAEGFSRDP